MGEIKSGIYAIVNTINGDMYIGSSSSISKRHNTHVNLLKNKKHHSVYLQRACNKYGQKNFIFIILLNCHCSILLEKELEFFNLYKPKYNMAISPGSPMRGRKHKKQTLLKMKDRRTPKGKDHHNYGKKLTPSHVEKIVKARSGRSHSEETKKKMRETAIRLSRYKDLSPAIEKNKRKVIDSLGNVFNSMLECSQHHDISTQTVCDILKGTTCPIIVRSVIKGY